MKTDTNNQAKWIEMRLCDTHSNLVRAAIHERMLCCFIHESFLSAEMSQMDTKNPYDPLYRLIMNLYTRFLYLEGNQIIGSCPLCFINFTQQIDPAKWVDEEADKILTNFVDNKWLPQFMA